MILIELLLFIISRKCMMVESIFLFLFICSFCGIMRILWAVMVYHKALVIIKGRITFMNVL